MFILITSSASLALPVRFFRQARLDEQLAMDGKRPGAGAIKLEQ
jgi:hypothetical protein